MDDVSVAIPPRKDLHHQATLRYSNALTKAKFSGKMTWSEFKVFAVVAAQIRQKDQNFVEYKTTVNDLCSLANLGMDESRYTRIRSILSGLVSRTVQLVTRTSPEDPSFRFRWFHFLEYVEYEEGSGNIFLRLPQEMREHLLGLRANFTFSSLPEFLKLESLAQGRLYLVLNSCKGFYDPARRTFSLSSLAKMLNITFTADRRADTVVRLRTIGSVLLERTSLEFQVVEIKEGKKIVAVRFDFPRPRQRLLHRSTDHSV